MFVCSSAYIDYSRAYHKYMVFPLLDPGIIAVIPLERKIAAVVTAAITTACHLFREGRLLLRYILVTG